MPNGEELEKIGLPGPRQIKNNLSKTRKTKTLLNAVKKFQNDNGIKMIGDSSGLLMNRLRELGALKTPESTAQLEKQLENCFKMYSIPQIRPIVLETMAQLPKLSEKYVELVVADPELYADSSIHVKQQVWLRHEDFYDAACRPVIDDYITAKQAILCGVDPSPTNYFSSETTKCRRQWKQIQNLVNMFGEYEVLYSRLMSVIRELFLESGELIYCSMKLEIIMAAHDAGSDLVKSDVCYELAWCMDMCMRDKHVDTQQSARIKNILENCKKLTPESLGDVAMVAADPHVTHFLCTTVLRLLREQSNLVPREQHGLQLLLRVVLLGTAAHRAVQVGAVPSQMVDVILFTKFLPAMASLIVEDLMRNELTKHRQGDEAEKMSLYSVPSDTILTFLKAESVAALLWIHYTVDLLPRRSLDVRGMLRYLRVMPILKDNMSTRSPWCHLLGHRLLTSPLVETLVNDQEVIGIILERLFLTSIKLDSYLKYQVLRIINQLYRTLHPSIGVGVMEHIAPQTFSDSPDFDRYSEVYFKVLNKITKKEEERPVFVAPPLPAGTPARMATPARIVPATPSHAFDSAVSDYV